MSQNSTMCSVFNNILTGYKYIQYNTIQEYTIHYTKNYLRCERLL